MARKRPLSLSMIRRLHQGLGIPAEVLIADLGSDLLASDEEALDFARFPLTELLNRGCLGEARRSARELKDYAEELIKPLLQALLPQRSAATALMRAPLHQRGKRIADPYALLAWRLCVLKRAREQTLPKRFEPGSLSADELRDIARLSSFATARAWPANAWPSSESLWWWSPISARPISMAPPCWIKADPWWRSRSATTGWTTSGSRCCMSWPMWRCTCGDEDQPLFIDDLEAATSERLEAEADALAQQALIPGDAWAKAAVPVPCGR